MAAFEATNSCITIHPLNRIHKKLLVKAVKLQNEGKLVDFAYGTEVKSGEFPLPSFKVNELGKNLQIPVTLEDIKIIRDASEKSLISSKSVCIAGEASSNKPETGTFCSALGDPCLPALISHHLQLPTKLINVTARLKNLELREQGNKCYIINICSCCVDGKFGTVFLQLPVEGGQKGGCLKVEYQGRKEVFENHTSSEKHFYISSFYNCCKDVKETITQGHQLTLVYDLIWTNARTSIPRDFPVFLTSLKQIKVALKCWTKQYAKKQIYTDEKSLSTDSNNSTDSVTDEDSSEDKNVNKESGDLLSENELKGNVLFFVLQEKYDDKSLSFKVLRGEDKKVAEFLLNCIFLDVHLAVATPSTKEKNKVDSWNVRPYNQTEIKPGDDEETDSVAFSHVFDSHDVTRNMSLELNWNRHFVGLEPQQEKKVYTGVPGDKIEKDKRYLSVLLIWPKHHSTQIYCRYGVKPLSKENSIPRCKLNEEPSLSSDTKTDIVMDKNDLILPSWAYSPVSKLSSSLTATHPTTPPTGWTTPLINTGGPRFDYCDSVSDGLASSTPRVGSSSSAVSSGEGWVEAVELKSSERNAAAKARTSAQKVYNWDSVWKGSVTYKDLKFSVAIEVFDVNKPTDFMKSVMPVSLEVVGNIDNPEKVWNYLKRVKETIDTEVIFLQCTPTSYADWNLYQAFCKACQDMDIAVLGGLPSPVKNLYLFPILKGRPIPKELVSLSSGIKLLENRASSLLLGILVLRKGQHNLYENNRRSLLMSATTSLGSKVVSQHSALLAPLAVDAVLKVIDPLKDHDVDLRDIRVIEKLGGTVDDTELVEGLVLDQRSAGSGGPSRMEKAKIGLIQFCISPPKTDMDNQVVVSDYNAMDRVLREERAYILNVAKQVKKAGCNVLLVQKSILRDAVSELALHFFDKMKIMVVKDIEREDIEFITKTLNCRPIASLDHFLPEYMATADLVESVPTGTSKVVKITGIQNVGKTVSVIVRGSNKLVLEEAARSLHDALCVIRCLVKKRFIIAGGGAPETELAYQLTQYAQGLPGVEAYCLRAFAESLEVIPMTLAENAGLNPIATVTDLRNKHACGFKSSGINVRKGAITNMLDEGVAQPLLVTTSAITLASETVRSILKIDDIVNALY